MLDSVVGHEGDVECRRLHMYGPWFCPLGGLSLCNSICD